MMLLPWAVNRIKFISLLHAFIFFGTTSILPCVKLRLQLRVIWKGFLGVFFANHQRVELLFLFRFVSVRLVGSISPILTSLCFLRNFGVDWAVHVVHTFFLWSPVVGFLKNFAPQSVFQWFFLQGHRDEKYVPSKLLFSFLSPSRNFYLLQLF